MWPSFLKILHGLQICDPVSQKCDVVSQRGPVKKSKLKRTPFFRKLVHILGNWVTFSGNQVTFQRTRSHFQENWSYFQETGSHFQVVGSHFHKTEHISGKLGHLLEFLIPSYHKAFHKFWESRSHFLETVIFSGNWDTFS